MTKPTIAVFDIETGPLPDDQLIKPDFHAPKNYIDPAKIAAYIQECQRKYMEGLALSPLSGQVLVIGILDNDGFRAITGTEKEILGQFWRYAESVVIGSGQLVGFDSNRFDLPFLFRRSWYHHMKPSPILRAGRYWSPHCVDVREMWQLGNREAEGNLDMVSRFLGGKGKTGDGAEFAGLWAEDKEKALEYLHNDLEQTKLLYELMAT